MQTHSIIEKSTASSFAGKRKQKPFFSPLVIQPKLTISPANDPYEREADSMADKVMRMTDHEALKPSAAPVIIQKKCAACEEEEKLQRKEENEEEQTMLQRKPIADLPIQRKCEACEREEKDIHRKESVSNSLPGITPAVHQVLQSSGKALDLGTRSFMESRFGYDFSTVRIHNDSLAHQSSSDINALAYTNGRHIVFGSGQYQPNTNSGKQLLAHELTHVVQQGSSHLSQSGRLDRDEDEKKKPALTRYQEIEQSIDTPGEFEVIQNPFGFSIYNFAINRYALKPEHKTILKKIGRMLESDKKKVLTARIVGNTDSTGSPAINNPLSVRRGKSVSKFLADMTGRKYSVEGEGEDMPVTTNETDTGRTRNRRADIIIDHPVIPIKHDPVPASGLILPPAYSYTAPVKIERDEFDLSNKKKPCYWPWCFDWPGIPWFPWFWLPNCVKLLLECDEGGNPEACYDFYEECIKGDEDPKRKACVEHAELPEGNLPVIAEWNRLQLERPFWMLIDFDNKHEIGCYCECGEYEQIVRGFFEIEDENGKVHRATKPLTPGVKLEPDKFHEDGSGAANSEYGYRRENARFSNENYGLAEDDEFSKKKEFFVDKFFLTQKEGCSYVGMDHPENYNDGLAQHGEVRRTWFLEFKGYPVDTCLQTQRRTPMLSYMKVWRVQGEIRRPPIPDSTVPKGGKPGGGFGPGGDIKSVRVKATKAKTHPSGSFPSWYGGGIDPHAQPGQEFDMTIDFHIPGKSEVYNYVQHVIVIDSPDKDFIKFVTTNDEDLNLGPANGPEIVLGAHRKMKLPRSIL